MFLIHIHIQPKHLMTKAEGLNCKGLFVACRGSISCHIRRTTVDSLQEWLTNMQLCLKGMLLGLGSVVLASHKELYISTGPHCIQEHTWTPQSGILVSKGKLSSAYEHTHSPAHTHPPNTNTQLYMYLSWEKLHHGKIRQNQSLSIMEESSDVTLPGLEGPQLLPSLLGTS